MDMTCPCTRLACIFDSCMHIWSWQCSWMNTCKDTEQYLHEVFFCILCTWSGKFCLYHAYHVRERLCLQTGYSMRKAACTAPWVSWKQMFINGQSWIMTFSLTCMSTTWIMEYVCSPLAAWVSPHIPRVYEPHTHIYYNLFQIHATFFTMYFLSYIHRCVYIYVYVKCICIYMHIYTHK